MSKEHDQDLLNEIARLNYLVNWVDEHGSFTNSEWEIWERLQQSKEPWLEDTL